METANNMGRNSYFHCLYKDLKRNLETNQYSKDYNNLNFMRSIFTLMFSDHLVLYFFLPRDPCSLCNRRKIEDVIHYSTKECPNLQDFWIKW